MTIEILTKTEIQRMIKKLSKDNLFYIMNIINEQKIQIKRLEQQIQDIKIIESKA